MSAASDRIQELVYPTKPRLYVGLGDPPDTRVTAADLKAVIDERAALLTALEDLFEVYAHVRLMPCDGKSHGPDTTEECEECGNASALRKRAEAAHAAITKARGGR